METEIPKKINKGTWSKTKDEQRWSSDGGYIPSSLKLSDIITNPLTVSNGNRTE